MASACLRPRCRLSDWATSSLCCTPSSSALLPSVACYLVVLAALRMIEGGV